MLPSILGGNLFDDFGGFSFGEFNHHTTDLMKTDVKENSNNYELTIDMPGIEKENVRAELKDGYLIISTSSGYCNDEKDNNGRYIRRERHYGSCSRSFYIGKAVTQDEIKANFKNGTLKLTVPKKKENRIADNKNYIQID